MPIQRRIGHRKNRLIAAVGLVAVLRRLWRTDGQSAGGREHRRRVDKPSKAVTLNILDVAGRTCS